MDELLTPAAIKALAAERGLTMRDVCSKAGIAASTFTRWQAEKTAPSIAIYQRIVAAARGEAA